jgi:integrase
VCRELKRQGLIKSYVAAGSREAVDFPDYLQNFWDFDNSPYVKEKLRKNHGIHRNYTAGQKLIVEKYGAPFFRDRLPGEITRRDIENFIDSVAGRNLSASRKTPFSRPGQSPCGGPSPRRSLKKTRRLVLYGFRERRRRGKYCPPETVPPLFRAEWADERSRLANLLAAVTGLRAGEIRGLRARDLGGDCLYIRHSWNFRDGLKTTKNNEIRTVEVPFPSLIAGLLDLAGRNPHGAGMDGYVFWSRLYPSKPMENRILVTGLRDALVKTGMSREEADTYVFHGWRHFFTAYMRDRLNEKLLQSQTGHKTITMLNHYSERRIAGDREKIRQAQRDVFGALMPIREL